jgi:hypothetical protein
MGKNYKIRYAVIRFKVLTVVAIKSNIFWDVMMMTAKGQIISIIIIRNGTCDVF